MRVAFGTDEETAVTAALMNHLEDRGHEVMRLAAGAEWPEVGQAVGGAVAQGRAERGVVCCTTGTGVSMAANKVPGVRAALCGEVGTAVGARRWNDANVLAIGLRLVTETLGRELVDAFLTTRADPEEAPAVDRLETSAPADRG